jgi:hypothetical protein
VVIPFSALKKLNRESAPGSTVAEAISGGNLISYKYYKKN